MIKKLLFTLSLCMLLGGTLFAQSTIKGEVKDPSGAPMQYFQVRLLQDGRIVNGAYTDDLGAYQIFSIPAGTYDISAGGTFACATTYTEKGIYVSASEVKFVNLTINCANELQEVEVVYKPPIFSQDNTTSAMKLTGDDVRKVPGRSISAVLSSLGGVASVDGKVSSVRGNRSDGQQTIIDGVRVRGNGGVPMQSIEGLELIQGGIPAEYGDGTSFTVYTTRGVAKDYHGGIELRSSLEGYGQMSGAFNLSGPILKGKNPQDPPRMGFLIAAEGGYNIDGSPAAGGTWVAKPDVIQNITRTPLEFRIIDNFYSPYYNAHYLGKDDFQKIRVRQNAQDWSYLAQAKIDIMGGGKDARGRAKNNLRFSIGGSYEYINESRWNQANALFNSANNGIQTQNTLRLNARLNHRVKTDTAANAILKNVMYDINVSYQLYNSKVQDKNYKDNLFAYGYIGKFSTERQDVYELTSMRVPIPGTTDTLNMDVPTLKNWQTLNWVGFDRDGYTNNGNYYNSALSQYTQNFADFVKEQTGFDINTTDEDERMAIRFLIGQNKIDYNTYRFLGLMNGQNPSTIANGLYTVPGYVSTGYGKSRIETIGAKLSLSLNIKDHEVKFGFELDKVTQRNYSIDPSYLWTLMSSLTADEGRIAFDFLKPYWAGGDTVPQMFQNSYDGNWYIVDTLMYPLIISNENFDMNLRAKRGITDQQVYLDINSYDPKDFSLDLFSNYELFNQGNSLIAYSGYDYLGNLSNKKTNLENFFTGENLHDKNKYSIGAFEPIYMALFLQDKFAISNLLFSVGLRLDYFNANQSVLKDPYLFSPAYTVGELKNQYGWNFPIDNVQDDWIPYVSIADMDVANAPQTFVAYRNGYTWYNSLGQEVTKPDSYLGAGGPVLIEAPAIDALSKVSYKAFTDYKPQWNIMPRISFSFPVSTNSLFYAHYNIVTYRPTNLQMNPIQYLYIEQIAQNRSIEYINNPNLRSQRSVDYEIGFRQAVGENAALSFSAFYSEKRDQLQSYRYSGAYPVTYYSLENQDFGTVQGFMLEMNMRGTKNLSFRTSYTISFAKGTGSAPGSNIGFIKAGYPNFKTLTNLSYDQRHNITANVNFRFGSGTEYNGPVTVKQKKGTDTKKEIRWLENTGAVLLFSAASGMPYSRSGNVFSELGWSGEEHYKGTINGANMPWTFRCDLSLSKTFMLNLASKKNTNENGKRKNKPGSLTFSLDFMNLLNLKNIISVYDYTGRPDDDGFLTSHLYQTLAATGIAFDMPVATANNYYQMRIANPYNYSQPFRVYLTVNFSF